MIVCERCNRPKKKFGTYVYPNESFEVDGQYLCRDCCIETDQLPEGFAFSKNLRSGNKIMIPVEDKGVPHLDPAYETYHCM